MTTGPARRSIRRPSMPGSDASRERGRRGRPASPPRDATRIIRSIRPSRRRPGPSKAAREPRWPRAQRDAARHPSRSRPPSHRRSYYSRPQFDPLRRPAARRNCQVPIECRRPRKVSAARRARRARRRSPMRARCQRGARAPAGAPPPAGSTDGGAPGPAEDQRSPGIHSQDRQIASPIARRNTRRRSSPVCQGDHRAVRGRDMRVGHDRSVARPDDPRAAARGARTAVTGLDADHHGDATKRLRHTREILGRVVAQRRHLISSGADERSP